MRQHPRELASDDTIHIFHDTEIGWEENIEVALFNLEDCDS